MKDKVVISSQGVVVQRKTHERVFVDYGTTPSIKAFLEQVQAEYSEDRYPNLWRTFAIMLRLVFKNGPTHLRTDAYETRGLEKACLTLYSAMLICPEFPNIKIFDLQNSVSNLALGYIRWDVLGQYSALIVDAYYDDIDQEL